MFAALRQSSDETVVDMLARMVRDAPDHALNKINALDLAGREGIDEERVIAALLNAVGLGIFEMTWNVMCPSCAGVLSANKSLKTLDRAQYNCAFCAAGYETTLDNLVEVTFTVSPRVRKIAAHNPDELSAAEYYRQIFWSSAIDLPDDLGKLLDDVTLEIVDLPAGERAILSLQVPQGTLIVFDPVTHTAQFLDVSGEETGERQNLSVIFNKVQVPVDSAYLASGAAAAGAGQPHRRARAAGGMGGEPGAGRSPQASQAGSHGNASAQQSDVSRYLPDRHARHRPASQDPEPDFPVQRSQGLHRAL